METPETEANENYIQEFKGGSMAKTFLIKKDNNLLVRKEVKDTSKLGLDKLEKQADWILDLEPEVATIFPVIEMKSFQNDFGYYDMSYHNMPSFRDYLINTDSINNDIVEIVKEIVSFGAMISSKEETESTKDKSTYIKKLHFDKMLKRCCIVTQKNEIFNEFFNTPSININGSLYDNFNIIREKILNDSEFMELLSPKKWYRSHGDFTFQNILTDGKQFKIIDPRGEGEDSIYYDLSKLFQSCKGKYDLFIDGNYSVNYSLNDNSIDYKIIEHEELFNDIFEVIKTEIPKVFNLEKEWEIITLFYEASHFVSMVPFRYEENLPFTLACYAIGIQKLNEVFEKWNKVKQHKEEL
ncbi:gp311 [Bacillus phage G]|uniref:Gp311 n=1 Tax=Bacillus phage G TaxID=2884420 RepID=G3MA52_9CAUD|nr:gp311 [Bacillus phage G]AEO93570.1 gp311 [Bacillus phage G]